MNDFMRSWCQKRFDMEHSTFKEYDTNKDLYEYLKKRLEKETGYIRLDDQYWYWYKTPRGVRRWGLYVPFKVRNSDDFNVGLINKWFTPYDFDTGFEHLRPFFEKLWCIHCGEKESYVYIKEYRRYDRLFGPFRPLVFRWYFLDRLKELGYEYKPYYDEVSHNSHGWVSKVPFWWKCNNGCKITEPWEETFLSKKELKKVQFSKTLKQHNFF
jgi:hypothetical protein